MTRCDVLSKNDVNIFPLDESHYDALKALRVKPEQEQFAVADAMQLADSLTELELPFVMLKGKQLAGFFFLDCGYAENHDFCPSDGAGVRMVMVDEAFQGHGIASAALALLPSWIKANRPEFRYLYLTVNCRNPGAYRCYQKCGYQDTGELFLGGPVGPQHIMKTKIT